jgi:hypothetical protein
MLVAWSIVYAVSFEVWYLVLSCDGSMPLMLEVPTNRTDGFYFFLPCTSEQSDSSSEFVSLLLFGLADISKSWVLIDSISSFNVVNFFSKLLHDVVSWVLFSNNLLIMSFCSLFQFQGILRFSCNHPLQFSVRSYVHYLLGFLILFLTA